MAFTNYYFSGQGILYVGTRDANGRMRAPRRVGNIPELTLDIATTKFEHKESESGNRLKDLVIIQEKNGTFRFTLENGDLDNLALGFWGDTYKKPAGSTTGEIIYLAANSRAPLRHPKVSSVAVSLGTVSAWVASTTYRVGDYVKKTTSPTNYAVAVRAGTSGGTEPTWPTDGTSVADNNIIWQDAGTIPGSITLSTDYTVDSAAGSIIAVDGGVIGKYGYPLSVNYSYAVYDRVDVFTSAAAPERYLRFEGLNTIDNTRIVVDIFKAQLDPLTGYGLINNELQQIQMAGSILADSLQPSNESQYFRITRV